MACTSCSISRSMNFDFDDDTPEDAGGLCSGMTRNELTEIDFRLLNMGIITIWTRAREYILPPSSTLHISAPWPLQTIEMLPYVLRKEVGDVVVTAG